MLIIYNIYKIVIIIIINVIWNRYRINNNIYLLTLVIRNNNKVIMIAGNGRVYNNIYTLGDTGYHITGVRGRNPPR